jgi:hypothetical protein
MKLVIMGVLSVFSINTFVYADYDINEEMGQIKTGPTRAEGVLRDPVKRQAIRGWDNIGNFGPTRAEGVISDPVKRQAIRGWDNIGNFGPTRAEGVISDPVKTSSY